MSRYVNFWSCDGCEQWGTLAPAEWKVQTVYGTLSLCDRHANDQDIDPTHKLRIGAILESLVGKWPV